MNIGVNLCKSTLLATGIFWLILFKAEVTWSIMPFVILSVLPIFLCCLFVISISICPFFFSCKDSGDKKRIFKTYFPIYIMISFIIGLTFIINCKFDIYVIAFFTSAFITTSQSWIWFTKDKSQLQIKK